MSTPSDETEELAADAVAQARKLVNLVEAILQLGLGFTPNERRAQLNAQLKRLMPSLVESNQLLETLEPETKSARDVLIAGPPRGRSAALIASSVPSSDYIARANAAFQQRMNPAVFAELAEQSEKRKAEAIETAQSLLAEQPELRELANAQPEAVARSLEILALQLRDRDAIMRWLNTQLSDLDMQTPLQFMREGHAEAVEGLLANTLAGIPS
jgi:hypothetical protein